MKEEDKKQFLQIMQNLSDLAESLNLNFNVSVMFDNNSPAVNLFKESVPNHIYVQTDVINKGKALLRSIEDFEPIDDSEFGFENNYLAEGYNYKFKSWEDAKKASDIWYNSFTVEELEKHDELLKENNIEFIKERSK